MTNNDLVGCPQCDRSVPFSNRRNRHYCDECQLVFDAPKPVTDPQTIFLSYAHKSEKEEDFDVSEELVILIKDELERDGHCVWIDKEGIRSGSQWRERITAAILSNDHFLSFLSRRAVRDPGVCLNEIAIALGHGRNIQTVLTDAEQNVSAPLTISHIQWHDFQNWREIRAGTKTGPYGEEWSTWFNQRMTPLRNAIADAQNAKTTGDLQRLRAMLEPRSFEARIIEKTEGFFGRQWLFDACQDWLDHSDSRLFWLKGSPGIGKSAFASKLVHRKNSAVIGFFMCDFQGMKDPEQSAREAICTLAFQMASRLPDYRLKLLYQQLVDRDKVLKKTADDLFEYLITEPLNKSGKIPEATRLTLVIDGLDEAGRNDGSNSLAELLQKHANRLPQWLGIVVTSRPEPYLEQTLGQFDTTTVDGQTPQNQQDLRDYVDQRLPSRIIEPERSLITDKVIEKSGGTFLYLRLLEQDKALDITQPEALPDKLDGFFKQTFNRYFPNPEEYGNKTEPFLRLLVAAPGPLPAGLAQDLLGWTERDLTLRVTEPLGSLLLQRDDGSAFFHASLPDWLKDPKRSGSHCVNSTGATELGDFLWREYERFPDSSWKGHIFRWLPGLLPYTGRWMDAQALEPLAEFLDDKEFLRECLQIRLQLTDLSRDRNGQTSLEHARSLSSKGRCYSRLSRYEDSEASLKHALAVFEVIIGADNHESLSAEIQLGDLYRQRGSPKDAIVLLESLYPRCLKYADTRPELFADCANSLGCSLSVTNTFEDARKYFQIALNGRIANEGAESKGVLIVMNNLANLCFAKSDYQEAVRIHEEVLKIRLKKGESGFDLALTHQNRGAALEKVGKLCEAQRAYASAIKIYENSLGPVSRELILPLTSLGNLLRNQDSLEKALACHTRAREIGVGTIGEMHPEYARVLVNLSVLVDDLDQKEKLVRQAHKIFYEVLGEHIFTALALGHVANISQQRGNFEAAKSLLQQGSDMAVTCVGSEHEYVGDLMHQLGDLNQSLNEYSEARAHYENALNIQQSCLGRNSPYIAELLRKIATANRSMGDAEGACENLRRRQFILENALGVNAPLSISSTIDFAETLLLCKESAQALVELGKAQSTLEELTNTDAPDLMLLDNLAYTHSMIARIHAEMGNRLAAILDQRKCSTVWERFVIQDPSDFDAKKGLAISDAILANLYMAENDFESAKLQYLKALHNLREVSDAESPESAVNVVVVMAGLATCLDDLGEHDAARNVDLELAETLWEAGAITGSFQKKSIANVITRLEGVYDECAFDVQVDNAIRCLTVMQTTSASALTEWRTRGLILMPRLGANSQRFVELQNALRAKLDDLT